MGIPFAIILMIILIMSMFAITAIIIYKIYGMSGNQIIDSPSSLNRSNKKKPEN